MFLYKKSRSNHEAYACNYITALETNYFSLKLVIEVSISFALSRSYRHQSQTCFLVSDISPMFLIGLDCCLCHLCYEPLSSMHAKPLWNSHGLVNELLHFHSDQFTCQLEVHMPIQTSLSATTSTGFD